MRSRRLKSAAKPLPLVLAFVLALALTGCGHPSGNLWEGGTIPPVSATPGTDLGLGSGVRPLSFGPGDKSSPRISPSGDRVAFILDGYVVEKPLYGQNLQLETSTGFGAEKAEWLSDDSLAALKPENEIAADGTSVVSAPGTLFGTMRDGTPDTSMLLEEVMAVGALPGGEAVAAAVAVEPTTGSPDEQPKSRLVLVRGPEQPLQVYLRNIKGTVTGLSISPDGREVALAVQREPDNSGESRFEVHSYRFSEGQPRRVKRLPKGMGILGAPQWTSRGIHFVAGKQDDPMSSDASAPHSLFRIPEGSDTPELVRGVGEDFIAASTSVSPDGNRLAVVGRRNPGSPTNLYVLDLASDTLKAATTNQKMEIKTNPRDLTWSPDGQSVVLISRGALSGPEVYDAPASDLSSAFYNLYEVPVTDLPAGEETEG